MQDRRQKKESEGEKMSEKRTRSIEGVDIYEASIIQTQQQTEDTDERGYYTADGTNRGICAAITTRGEVILYITTNGDDTLIPEDPLEAARVIEAMGDRQQTPREAIMQGCGRLIEAAREMTKIWCEEGANEDLNWYEDQATKVEDWLED